ncbi:mannose-1-phosphate guanylyltransferase/ mannose-6-phosphate isomerase [Denitrovibrio acetiphilus DSM 12809]|uniref:mannose-1-phosphate guanylyltransferase n=1 Tax=Denitrovibrio acetiphilus (strain DSM 12809 / NBRC 114555 / N2460) TaxID=522772 RepID=D4H5U9_DENA2|nr:mannose-1-phosphate guanylyltransferase/mannose-6-phosphate isomerase [Denitrovibrio acetiphilus]ADD69540.1 mannose-1-phosphate guanylyltransferase/ mannose-6-phosphate isomerase [Denitrovibrio acetiphilus DSM 12809]
MINVILCGGSGTRLWPISRKSYPKQFCKIINDRSFFQETILRNIESTSHLIVTSIDNYFIAADQAEAVNDENLNFKYILEPVGRNTAPAIAIACFAVDPEAVILVTPSDHLISNVENYDDVIKEAEKSANNGDLVTFGIKPEYAETGYGYLECSVVENSTVVDVLKFHEKPSKDVAEKYLLSGNYYWNSGMFCFKASTFLKELKKYSPDIYEKSKIAYLNAANKDMDKLDIDIRDMQAIPADSIDYAVMEKSNIVKAIKADIGWNDIGSFDALSKVLNVEESEDCCSLTSIAVDSDNNFIMADDKQVVTIDVSDLIIIDTPDALLISKKGSSQDVKKAVEIMSAKTETLCLLDTHKTVNRPWGTYCVIESGYGYKVKKIVVLPGRRLSLQSHKQRSEHWVVVSGEAKVTRGEEILNIKNNESIYISAGTKHRLECISNEPLIIIEVQVGAYLGEDDITRYSDDYNRK